MSGIKNVYTFIDGETNTTYTVELDEEEYAKAENDLEYATTILENIKKAAASDQNVSECEEAENQDEPSSSFIWTDAATLMFIQLYKEEEPKLSKGKITHKTLWDKISNKMKAHDFSVSSKQCSTKLASLKRMYKTVKDHNNQTGTHPKTWKYYKEMDEIFSTKPWITPLATVSSVVNVEKETINEQEPAVTPVAKRKKMERLLETIYDSKEKKREETKKQHDDKMQRLDAMNELLGRLVAAAEKNIRN